MKWDLTLPQGAWAGTLNKEMPAGIFTLKTRETHACIQAHTQGGPAKAGLQLQICKPQSLFLYDYVLISAFYYTNNCKPTCAQPGMFSTGKDLYNNENPRLHAASSYPEKWTAWPVPPYYL